MDDDIFINAGGKTLNKIAGIVTANEVRGIPQLLIFDTDNSLIESKEVVVSQIAELELTINEHFFIPNNEEAWEFGNSFEKYDQSRQD